MTSKTLQETIRRGRNRSIEAELVKDYDDDDYDDIMTMENRTIFLETN
jgi:hypothetical protein